MDFWTKLLALIASWFGKKSPDDPVPKPDPKPDPKPSPEPSPTPDPADAVPIGDIVWHGGDPSGYKRTAQLTSVSISGARSGPCRICWAWKVPDWPEHTKRVIGNAWIGYKGEDGKWHMGVWEMCRAEASVCRISEARPGQPPLIQAHGPIGTWYPASGALVLYMISTPTRGVDAAGDVTRERSNIVVTKWP